MKFQSVQFTVKESDKLVAMCGVTNQTWPSLHACTPTWRYVNLIMYFSVTRMDNYKKNELKFKNEFINQFEKRGLMSNDFLFKFMYTVVY